MTAVTSLTAKHSHPYSALVEEFGTEPITRPKHRGKVRRYRFSGARR